MLIQIMQEKKSGANKSNSNNAARIKRTERDYLQEISNSFNSSGLIDSNLVTSHNEFLLIRQSIFSQGSEAKAIRQASRTTLNTSFTSIRDNCSENRRSGHGRGDGGGVSAAEGGEEGCRRWKESTLREEMDLVSHIARDLQHI